MIEDDTNQDGKSKNCPENWIADKSEIGDRRSARHHCDGQINERMWLRIGLIIWHLKGEIAFPIAPTTAMAKIFIGFQEPKRHRVKPLQF